MSAEITPPSAQSPASAALDKKATSPDVFTAPGHTAVDHAHAHEHDTDIDMESGLEKPAADDGAVVDAVWGRIEAGAPNYRALSWLGASVLLTKIQEVTGKEAWTRMAIEDLKQGGWEADGQVGLGILGLPLVMRSMGLVPGILIIIGVALICTWTGYILGVFKRRHPEVYTIADIGYVVGGRFGGDFLTFVFWLQMVTCLGSGLVGLSIALNAVSLHALCTVVWVVIVAVVAAAFGAIRTLDKISWLGWAGIVSIVGSVITLTVSVGVQDRPAEAPQTGPWVKEVIVAANPGFVDALNAVNTVVLSYGGVSAYVSVAGEMRHPREYAKAMFASHTFMTAVYLVISCVCYHYVGQYIASPALGSAGVLMKRICYGLAIPGLLASSVIFVHLSAKTVFVRILRGTKHLTSNSWQHWTLWLGLIVINTALAFVLAEGIPQFGDLLALIGSLLSTFLSISFPAGCYVWLIWRNNRDVNWEMTVAWSLFIVVLGTFLQVAGSVTSIMTIVDNAKNAGGAFSCKDNSNSV